MAPNPPRKLSIEEQGGIRVYLEKSRTKHNDNDADRLLQMVRDGVAWTKIASHFNVSSTNTIKTWYQMLLIEKSKND